MRLEDALLYLILDEMPGIGMKAFCEAAVAGGVDVIHLSRALAGEGTVACEVCKRADALLIISDDAAAARIAGADGVHIGDATAPVGRYRVELGMKGIVGVSTRSRNDALLALEMGVDYLLHWAGTRCAAEFATLPGAVGSKLFAAGLRTLEDAQTVVESGIYRLCIEADLLEGGDITGKTAAFSRILGRSMS